MGDNERQKFYSKMYDNIDELKEGERLIDDLMKAITKFNAWQKKHDVWRINPIAAGNDAINAKNKIIAKMDEFKKAVQEEMGKKKKLEGK